MSVQTLKVSAVTDRRAGKYLTFVLSGEEYGLEILKVREINGMKAIRSVPRMPDYMKGVINLRGKIIPVIDLRLKFSMSETESTAETCIIVVDVGGSLIGIIVDQVSEVLDIHGEDIEDAPVVGADLESNFILGMGKAKGSVKILLNIDKVLSGAEYDELAPGLSSISDSQTNHFYARASGMNQGENYVR
jgi:purine-binding chemotaxis protein CheW